MTLRSQVHALPFTVACVFDRERIPDLKRRVFAWDLHASGGHLLPTTLLGALYCAQLRFLQRDYATVARLLGSCVPPPPRLPGEKSAIHGGRRGWLFAI